MGGFFSLSLRYTKRIFEEIPLFGRNEGRLRVEMGVEKAAASPLLFPIPI